MKVPVNIIVNRVEIQRLDVRELVPIPFGEWQREFMATLSTDRKSSVQGLLE